MKFSLPLLYSLCATTSVLAAPTAPLSSTLETRQSTGGGTTVTVNLVYEQTYKNQNANIPVNGGDIPIAVLYSSLIDGSGAIIVSAAMFVSNFQGVTCDIYNPRPTVAVSINDRATYSKVSGGQANLRNAVVNCRK